MSAILANRSPEMIERYSLAYTVAQLVDDKGFQHSDASRGVQPVSRFLCEPGRPTVITIEAPPVLATNYSAFG
jgi:hypothetical protein